MLLLLKIDEREISFNNPKSDEHGLKLRDYYVRHFFKLALSSLAFHWGICKIPRIYIPTDREVPTCQDDNEAV